MREVTISIRCVDTEYTMASATCRGGLSLPILRPRGSTRGMWTRSEGLPTTNHGGWRMHRENMQNAFPLTTSALPVMRRHVPSRIHIHTVVDDVLDERDQSEPEGGDRICRKQVVHETAIINNPLHQYEAYDFFLPSQTRFFPSPHFRSAISGLLSPPHLV